jgi:dipeptidyl aminopeptidase/acylaminoacyl peptidase
MDSQSGGKMKLRLAVLTAVAFWLLAWCAAASRAAEKHAFTADDWSRMRSARPIAVAPDGATILYGVDFGGEKGPNNHEWRLVDAGGTNSRKLDLPAKFTPLGFARSGSALFGLLAADKGPQLAIVSLDQKSAPLTVLTDMKRGIRHAAISPDGTRFAVLADSQSPDVLEGVHTVVEAEQLSLYVVNTDGSAGSWWCPALHDVASIAWSPDSASLAVLSQTPKIGNHFLHSFVDVCSASGPRHAAEIPNAATDIAWADEGRDLAFISTTTHVLTPDHLWTVGAAGGTPVDRTPELKGSAFGVTADPHGNVWVEIGHGVQNEVDAFRDGKLTTVYRWPEGVILGPPVFSPLASAPERLAFTVDDPLRAPNVAVAEGNELKKITNEGDEDLANVELGPVRMVHWTSKEKIALEGIVTFPAGYVAGQKYPFLVLPHGGPEANDVLAFDPFSRIIAGLGYVVLEPEYRGSTGYGSAFLDAIYQHFGDRAYRDVDSATDYAISEGWADPARLAIFGWSAGGFMTSWTVTQTHRYRAAVEGAGITDWGSFMYTSDLQQIDYDARWPDENPEAFSQFSAVMFAKNVSTPLLVLHGAADERVPTYQGREFFEMLAARGKTTRMVTYPGSPHFPQLWEQRRDVFHEVAAWLARYNP